MNNQMNTQELNIDFSKTTAESCEKCESKLDRVITGGTGLIFKGSGFYLTDYKNDTKSKDGITESNNSEKNGSTKKDNPESKGSGTEKKSTKKKEKENE